MNFNRHSECDGRHATFGASQPSWLNYDDEKLVKVAKSKRAAEKGTILHEWAQQTIKLGIFQDETSKKALNHYVNDAIGYCMSTEVHLKYSEDFFGTADAISFDENTKFLRIHDLKTGTTTVHMEQLMIYAALFCLEYRIDPMTIDMELRIYQRYPAMVLCPDPKDIKEICDKIVHNDNILRKSRLLEAS